MAFPVGDRWCLIAHDERVSVVPWLQSDSWTEKGNYSAPSVSNELFVALEPYPL